MSIKVLVFTPGSCKDMPNSGILIFEGVEITFNAILSEIWDLDDPYYNNLE